MFDEIEKELNEKYGKGNWHCDDLWNKKTLPDCVQKYLDVARASAFKRIGKEVPKLFATYNGEKVRVVMASRFGDIGITRDLNAEYGYEERVYLPELENFSETK